jgi:hypothetical protein
MNDAVQETARPNATAVENRAKQRWLIQAGFWGALAKWLVLLAVLFYVSEAIQAGTSSSWFGAGVARLGYFLMMALPIAAFPAGLSLSKQQRAPAERGDVAIVLLVLGLLSVSLNGYGSPLLARIEWKTPPSGYRPPQAQFLHEVRASLKEMEGQEARLALTELPADAQARARAVEEFRRERRVLRGRIEFVHQHYAFMVAFSLLPAIVAALGWFTGLWARLVPPSYQLLFCWLTALAAVMCTGWLTLAVRLGVAVMTTLLIVPVLLLLGLGGTWLLVGRRVRPLFAA